MASEPSAALIRQIRTAWVDARKPGGGRLGRLPDVGTQIFPLDCPDRLECLWVPPYFWKFCMWFDPLLGFWPYQVRAFDHFFRCWYERMDGTQRQARQTGKSTMTPLPLTYLVQEERAQLVIASTKVDKVAKITRPIRRAMLRMGQEMLIDSIGETRFIDDAGYKALSGREDAKKESETGDVVLVDEAQDIPYSPTYKEMSPMRKGVGGIFYCMGVGGGQDSLMMKMVEQANVLSLNIEYDQIPERPQYTADVETERPRMLSFEFNANYRGALTTKSANSLIENLPAWHELFPGVPFNTDMLRHPEIGIDFAEVQDDTCAIAAGWYEDIFVLYDFDYYPKGESTDVSIAGLVKFMMRTDWERLRPETNNLGREVVKQIKKLLQAALADTDWRGDVDELWSPVTATEYNIDKVIRRIYALSAAHRICYVNDGRNPHMKRVIADLRNVTVKKGAKGLLKHSHSDPLSALRTMLIPPRRARLAA